MAALTSDGTKDLVSLDHIADLRTVVNQLSTLANELKTDFNALLAKLDADSGVGDTNYVSLRTVSSSDADTVTAPTY